ncbi:hypothetical protein M9H77_25693 [Catharanthus roseus]|uniref:Uncharacterized protein n=1 Tax=Catharanthus roseus TaxID=4058 RepID=A0ACC0A9F8_CATRO|nr:hypothetical protein M9H77_25693 [Catharanthus roseus]
MRFVFHTQFSFLLFYFFNKTKFFFRPTIVHFMDSKSSSGQDVLIIRANSDDPMKAATILTTYKAVFGRYKFYRDNDESFHEGFAIRDNHDSFHEGFVTRNNDDSSHEGFATRNNDDSFHEGFSTIDNGDAFHEGFATRNNDNSFHESFHEGFGTIDNDDSFREGFKFAISESLNPPRLYLSCFESL